MTTIPRSAEEQALIETARRVLPAGGFGNTDSDIVLRQGRGGRVTDSSGCVFKDFS